MPPDLLLPLVLAALVTLYFLVRWITIRFAEADLQKPLGEVLDRLIKQVKYHEVTPLQDLRVFHMGANPGGDDPNDTSTHYEIYPSCSHYFVIAHIGREGAIGTKLDHRAGDTGILDHLERHAIAQKNETRAIQ